MSPDADLDRAAATAAGSPQRDPGEILRVLNRLAGDRLPVQAELGDDGAVVHTRVLGLASDGRTVFLEWDADQGERLVRGVRVWCEAAIDHARVRFDIEPRAGEFQRTRAVRSRVPDVVVKLQRREYYRLGIGPDDGVACSLLLPHPGGQPKATDVEVVDLSGTGMAFVVPLALGAQLRMRVELGGCTIALPELGELHPTVRVRGLRKVDGQGAAPVRVGCEFDGMRVEEVGLVQRFIARVERGRREQARGR